jgi:hypothetical protein
MHEHMGTILGLRRGSRRQNHSRNGADADAATGPQSQMPGIVGDCDKYYLVKWGDSCYTLETAQKVILA